MKSLGSLRCAVALLTLIDAGAVSAQTVCARQNVTWWQLGATRFFQSSGEGQRTTGIGLERHFIDRRTLRKNGPGFRLDIRREKLGLRDAAVNITVSFGANGAVTGIAGDTGSLSHDVSPLLMLSCAALRPGRTFPDHGGRVDTVRTEIQRSITHAVPKRAVSVGAPIDTLGAQLLVVSALRSVADTSQGQLLRQQPNQVVDTVRPWTVLTGEELERQLIRASDGAVVFRERTRKLTGRGWIPPHPVGDTVPVRVEYASVERVTDSTTAAQVIAFPRRGDLSVSATPRDTVAFHWKEWRGDTLIARQIRRSGWRDELRTVWRDSTIVSATLLEPGSATQQVGPFQRQLSVERGFLRDAGSTDSVTATPSHPWAIALDGFEDAIVPALLQVLPDSQPHRFSMYGMSNDRGAWLNWSVTVVARGGVRVARFSTLQRQWVGTFVFTPPGELLLAVLGGPAGMTRLPAAGSRLAAVLAAQRGNIKPQDMGPGVP